MVAPTVSDIEAWSQLDFDELGYSDDAALEVLLDRSIEYVEDATGRSLATMPSQYEKTAEEAIQRRTEQLALQSQQDIVEMAGDFDTISNFSVTGYSESRRGLDEVQKAKVINPWPLLNDLLWRMATDDKRDKWREFWGEGVPAFEVTEMDWDYSSLPPSYLSPGA